MKNNKRRLNAETEAKLLCDKFRKSNEKYSTNDDRFLLIGEFLDCALITLEHIVKHNLRTGDIDYGINNHIKDIVCELQKIKNEIDGDL